MYSRVNHVQFGILGPDEIRAMSVVEVTEHERYEKNIPKENGLMDLRLGTIDSAVRCKTCECTMTDCPGHFGHIELARPVFNVGFMGNILKVLRMICLFCNNIVIAKSDVKYVAIQNIANVKHRFKQLYTLCNASKTCGVCKQPKPHISKNAMKITMNNNDDDDGGKRTLTAEQCYNIFKEISDSDCRVMGFDPRWSRPEYFIITVLPVSPPQVRPSVSIDDRSRGEDDITHKLVDILKANKRLAEKELNGSRPDIIAELWDKLQYDVATMMQNPIPGYPPAFVRVGSREIKAIENRLKSKEGRIRGNLMGKRVDFAARSVITPDPNLYVDEIGVPKQIAMNLTYPEVVTPHNITKLYDLVRNGPTKYPGAKYIVKSIPGIENKTQRCDLRFAKRPVLQIGDRVERHLVDGDLVIFNRQPSLHKMSMMGHRVRVMPYKTFRLNLSVTTPYNADFDGDEMNMHVPQSPEAKAEVQELMMVSTQIISPQANRPVIGLVQDALVGAYLMTQRDTFIEKDMLMNMLMWLPDFDYSKLPVPAILKPKELWTGKQVFGVLLPSNINVVMKSNMHDDDDTTDIMPDTKVIVHNGEILSGVLDKKSLGTSQGSLVHVITNENGIDEITKFLSLSQQLVNYWLLHIGFSVGVSDIFGDKETELYVEKTINDAEEAVRDIIKTGVQCKPGLNQEDSLESDINSILDKARDDAGLYAAKSLQRTNNISKMVNSGSKGSPINLAQVVTMVGQQNVNGKRIPLYFGNDRTLPHFTRFDKGPASRGFVRNSFQSGLDPWEFFFHAISGRVGLIDTAVKTSETGYIQRRLVKAMEDIMVHYDGTVRNSLGHVLEFRYGEDGFDGTKIETQFLENINKSDEEMRETYMWDNNDEDDEEYKQIMHDKKWLQLHIIPNGERRWPLPVNLKRLLCSAKLISNTTLLLDRGYIIARINDEAERYDNELFRAHLRSFLASKRVIEEYKLSKSGFDWMLEQIRNHYRRAMVNPGEMVGALAAQSIAEPATQMTLNTFHFTGIASKNVTLGVPRLNELINVSKKNKTPSLTVYLEPGKNKSLDEARMMQQKLEYCNLRNVVKETSIFYDPDDCLPKEDVDIIEAHRIITEPKGMSPWVMRIVLDTENLMDTGLTITKIARKLQYYFEDYIEYIYGDDNYTDPILRLRYIGGPNDDGTFLHKLESVLLDSIVLNGIPGITKVYTREDNDEWLLDTDGINLLDVLGVPGVDQARTTSNNVTEILETLGIEAARMTLLSELKQVLSFDGSYVNYRHLAILVETMCHAGHLMSITRHGINRTETGALTRCSFEETSDILLDSAVFSSKDKLNGVSGNIILGQLAPIGTACFDMFLNTDMLKTISENPISLDYNTTSSSTTTTINNFELQPIMKYIIEEPTYYIEYDEPFVLDTYNPAFPNY